MSPSSGVNISGPVAGTFHHSKETTIPQPAGTPKQATRRPQIPIPDIPAQGELTLLSHADVISGVTHNSGEALRDGLKKWMLRRLS